MKKILLFIFGTCFTTINFAGSLEHFSPPLAAKISSLKSSHLLNLTSLIADGTHTLAIKDPITGIISYTHDGRFLQKEDGYYYQGDKRLQGFSLPEKLSANTCMLTDVKSPMGIMPAQASSTLTITQLNLAAGDLPAASPFNPNNPASYNFRTSAIFYDQLGNTHQMEIYFAKTEADTWMVPIVIDQQIITTGNLVFKSSGVLEKSSGLDRIIFASSNNEKQLLHIEPENITQYSTNHSASPLLNDGYASGDPIKDVVDENGYIAQIYTNGQSITFSKIAVYN